MEPVARKEPVSERRDDTSTDDDQDESYPVHSVLAIEPIIYLERCRRLRAPQGDQNGNHNLYERPESQARPKTTNHGGESLAPEHFREAHIPGALNVAPGTDQGTRPAVVAQPGR